MTHPGTISRPRQLDQTGEVNKLRHLSTRAGKAYRYWIIQYVRFHNLQHPADLLETRVRDLLSMLAATRKVSASTQDEALIDLVPLHRHPGGAPPRRGPHASLMPRRHHPWHPHGR